VTPGATRTPIWSRIAPTEKAHVELERRLSHYVPLGRLGEADDVAQAVLYLASDDTRNVTGTEIVLDGGTTGAPYGAAVFTQR
jgi:NAD(P)-dependent dehydrogenase (short-subunit alcohol dehydrogenase family)